jgi:hypothetical protein
MLLLNGCHQGPGMVDAALDPAMRFSDPRPVGFWPAEVAILPLTTLTATRDDRAHPYIHLFVGLRDPFRCNTKAPGVFRVELYEHAPRSAQTKGHRLTVWPDIDLNEAERNQLYWRDYLRCYEFRLDLTPGLAQLNEAILEVTFLSANDQRLNAQYPLILSPARNETSSK